MYIYKAKLLSLTVEYYKWNITVNFSPPISPVVCLSCLDVQTLYPQLPGVYSKETLLILQMVKLRRAPSPQREAWHIPTVDDHLDCPLPLHSDVIKKNIIVKQREIKWGSREIYIILFILVLTSWLCLFNLGVEPSSRPRLLALGVEPLTETL